ncbi:MAG: TRAP transporter large permease subunit [Desulfobacteraceae bacterium]|nr:TRAP transporter large permease subunit [Desulfobacteraceae bacterium]
MEWYILLGLFFGGLMFLMFLGIPVAFAFLLAVMAMGTLVWGFETGMAQIVQSLSGSLINFSLLPIPLFVLMGEIVFRSGISPQLIDAVDKIIGKLPGRLSLMAVTSGVLFSTLTGTSIASTAMLGGTLVPEMESRGYSKTMCMGPILGSGGLALMIPPSALAVMLGAIAEVSIGKILVAIIVPGILMALAYTAYIVSVSVLRPDLAPPYAVTKTPIKEKLAAFARYILPVGFIIFMVVGVIYIGVATPTEASATGALGCFLYSLFLRRLNMDVVKNALQGTVKITIMIFMIVATAGFFSEILAYSGATNGLTNLVLDIQAHPIIILIAMLLLVFLLGMFMNAQAVIMILIPVYMPVISVLNFDPVWFSVLFLLMIEVGTTSPPFGLALFVMKGVAPPDTQMKDVMWAAVPYIILDIIVLAVLIAFPSLVIFLVGGV